MSRDRVFSFLALTLVVATGILALWTPFGVDQAIFVYGGQTAASGGALYRDFWDIKPPGIPLLYALAGSLFSFSEPGIHAAEIFWQLFLALLLLHTARRCVSHRQAAAVAPIAAVATYFAAAGSTHLTQVEALVGLPVTASLLLASRSSEQPHRAGPAILLGLAAGIVAALKPLYLVLPVAFGLLAVVRCHWAGRRTLWRGLGHLLANSALGFVLVWFPLTAYFAFHGALREMLWTTFAFPSAALLEVPRAPWQRLLESARWTAGVFAPWLPLLLLGVVALRRPRNSMLSQGTILYLFLAASLILAQKISWWDYHFVLLFPPLGLLASLGVDRLLRQGAVGVRARPSAIVVAFLLLLLPAVDLASRSVARLVELKRASRKATDAALAVRLDDNYLAIWNNTRFLRNPAVNPPGTVYVFGDFRLVLLSRQRQSIAVHGHAWHHLPASFWETLPQELMASEPAYIFVGGFYRQLLRQRAPDLWRYIRENYRPVGRHRSGRWLQRSTRKSTRPVTARDPADARTPLSTHSPG